MNSEPLLGCSDGPSLRHPIRFPEIRILGWSRERNDLAWSGSAFSIPGRSKRILRILPGHRLVAYLCIGHVRDFPPAPESERTGRLKRLPQTAVAFWEHWGQSLPAAIDSFVKVEAKP